MVGDLMSFAAPETEAQGGEERPELDRAKEVLARHLSLLQTPAADKEKDTPKSSIDEHIKKDQEKRRQRKRITKEEKLQLNLQLHRDHLEKMNKLKELVEKGESGKVKANSLRHETKILELEEEKKKKRKDVKTALQNKNGHSAETAGEHRGAGGEKKQNEKFDKEIQAQLRANKEMFKKMREEESLLALKPK